MKTSDQHSICGFPAVHGCRQVPHGSWDPELPVLERRALRIGFQDATIEAAFARHAEVPELLRLGRAKRHCCLGWFW